MGKPIKKVFFVLVALSIGYYVYTSYKKSSALLGVVHQDAHSIIKVGIHDLKETLILDALGAPRYYYKNSKSSSGDIKEEDEEKEGSGVELTPYNLLLFTMPDIENTVFSVFRIDDATDFEKYIKREINDKVDKIHTSDAKAYQFAWFKNGNIALAWNTEKLIVAGSLKIEKSAIRTVFKEVLVDGKTIDDSDHDLIKAVKEAPGHLVYADTKGISTVSFKDGAAVLRGNALTSRSHTKEFVTPVYQDPSLSFHYDLNLKQSSEKEKLAQKLNGISFFSKNNLTPLELLQPFDGALSLCIAGRTAQNDTIVTYGYDDNFEKIAQKTIERKEVPQFYMNLGSTQGSVKEYLLEAGALSNSDVFKPFPLYQLRVSENDSRTTFNTGDSISSQTQKTSSYFFNLQANFNRLQQDMGIPQTEKLFSLLKNMRVQAWQEAEDEIQIEGFIKAKEEYINILSQVFFGLNAEKDDDQEAKL
ncbi:hypothetical protein LV716_08025 [Flagellimonas sp. HMM57]|uniref:hypothetical protein n=1 Tax=unclassified Flagellimonas TaxID=2644544 RepID=UPI0013D6767E|nr:MULTISPECIES: hypothetical protein [unclassified Flagellimonas]UII77702.1 hypothetical protein LV716_08025 [Flagellimonas sp. HMM57]